MTSIKHPSANKLHRFFDAYVKDCTQAEITFSVPSVVLLCLAAYCSDLEEHPVNNNVFNFEENLPVSLSHIYHSKSDAIFHFALYCQKTFNFEECADLIDVCKLIINSPFGALFIKDQSKAISFCSYALPVFFNFAFEPEAVP